MQIKTPFSYVALEIGLKIQQENVLEKQTTNWIIPHWVSITRYLA